MGTVADFIALLNANGSNAIFHRSESQVVCPCVTPEGYRDPEWHDAHPPGSVRLDLMTDPTSYTNPPWVSISHDGVLQTVSLKVELEALPNLGVMPEGEGGIAMYLFLGQPGIPYPDPINVAWAFWQSAILGPGATPQSAWASIVSNPDNWVSTPSDLQRLGYLGSVKSQAGGNWYVWTSLPGDYFDWDTGAYVGGGQDTGTWEVKNVAGNFNPATLNSPLICDESGMLPGAQTIMGVKAFVQPIQSTRATRLSAEYMARMFGEIQADDHLGIFPEAWNGTSLDFFNWSQTGQDFIEYDNRRFMVVNANLIPDPDGGNPRHHWEVGLRAIGVREGEVSVDPVPPVDPFAVVFPDSILFPDPTLLPQG